MGEIMLLALNMLRLGGLLARRKALAPSCLSRIAFLAKVRHPRASFLQSPVRDKILQDLTGIPELHMLQGYKLGLKNSLYPY